MEFTMVLSEATRRQSRRDGLRYASNLTDAEWALIEPFMPAARRAVVEAILYLASTGCQWRQLPREFPPYFHRSGLFRKRPVSP